MGRAPTRAIVEDRVQVRSAQSCARHVGFAQRSVTEQRPLEASLAERRSDGTDTG
jgi:hypothetical protein